VISLAWCRKFREDLLYRINAVPLVVPPLRERGRDVVLLARHLGSRIGAELGRPGLKLSGRAEALLETLPWPGNVRQLRNVLERAALMSGSDVVEPDDLGEGGSDAAAVRAADDPRMSLAEAERRHIEGVLRAEQWNVRAAAAVLGLSRTALYDRIKKHGIRLGTSD
jgi:DNA-binding NtrC family response regulator